MQLVPGHRLALVAGLRKPATYLSPDVVEALTRDELTAVLEHERHHEITHAPLRLAVLAGIVGPLAIAKPIARYTERYRARLEIEADAHALAGGISRRSIARAILKLADPREALGGAPAFASAAELRLRVLLGDPAPKRSRLREDAAVATAIAGVIVIVCSAVVR